MEDMAQILKSRCEAPPFKYLGMNVGCRHKRSQDWNYVIEKVRNRLGKWSNLNISLGGRITLVKSVLSAIPTYALSVFRAPLCVIKKIISMQQVFLWGGRVGERRIVWAKWDFLSLPRALGGLGVRDLASFNKALIGKWAWRALEGGDALWVDLIKSKVLRRERGASGSDLLHPTRKIRGWWGEVLACLSDKKGNWFENQLVRSVGNGESTSFWRDCWVGEVALCETFPRLFRLCLEKECSVARAGRWVDDRWEWGVRWRREFRDCDRDSLQNLLDLLVCRNPGYTGPDKWKWMQDTAGSYSVKSGYNIILERKREEVEDRSIVCNLLWRNLAAPKAQATAWRIIFRKIATKTELSKRGVIFQHDQLGCALCNEEDETINHLFFVCNRAWMLWNGVLASIGARAVLPKKASENLHQFCFLAYGKKKRKVMATI